ncbi:general amidase [Hyaloraphidium curvatum]|nr:general amidase [Hyaloraphidium curvatum]
MPPQSWESVRDAKLAAKKAAYARFGVEVSVPESRRDVTDVPRECGKLTERELEITETPASALLRTLASGELSAVDVVTAFGKRALVADQVVNCLTEIFIDAGIERARELDAHLAATGAPVGPLHGLPISLKDQFHVAGIDTTMGYSAFADQPAEADCDLVVALRRAGAVLFVRTNVPQSLMVAETTNPVFGTTTNPRNRTLTCGGSSGGEGALLAMKGSPLGVGTDIGGSIRVPSAFNSLYGLKPSSARLPYGGARNSLLGMESVVSSLGPMSPDLAACGIFVRAVLAQEPWRFDPSCLRMPWDGDAARELEVRKPVFGYLLGDGNLERVAPPVERAVLDTVAKLRAAGYEVKPFDFPVLYGGAALHVRIITADGAKDIARDVEAGGDPWVPGLAWIPPRWGRRSARTSSGRCDLLNRQKDALRRRALDAWNAAGIDALILPPAPLPAVPHGKMAYMSYTARFNLLDMTAGIVPHSFVLPSDAHPEGYMPKAGDEERVAATWGNGEAFEGAPVCVQVVCRRFEEEKCLAVMEVVDAAIRGGAG